MFPKYRIPIDISLVTQNPTNGTYYLRDDLFEWLTEYVGQGTQVIRGPFWGDEWWWELESEVSNGFKSIFVCFYDIDPKIIILFKLTWLGVKEHDLHPVV